MPVRVRIQNFQSIEECTVEINGLTVITGPNNSGKTAVMRAVRGVFTNSPAGPLVRHGAAHLTVTLTFDDGTVIVWEKGWEKPGGKGKTVNRYTLNGKELPNVGRGVPPEIADLGVREIQAASDRVWPQIAQQFDGTLFLINRPGSAVAEALSDVDKVGRLTKALKASEKDRRSTTDELKVRRKDKKTAQDDADAFSGLDKVLDQVRSISKDQILGLHGDLKSTHALNGRLKSARSAVETLKGFDPTKVPGPDQAQSLREAGQALGEAESLNGRLKSARSAVETLKGFSVEEVPAPDKAQRLQALLEVVRAFSQRHRAALSEVKTLSAWDEPTFPDATRVARIREAVSRITDLRERHRKAKDALTTLEDEESEAVRVAQEAEDLVRVTLGERGLCPTCQTVHDGNRHAENRP